MNSPKVDTIIFAQPEEAVVSRTASVLRSGGLVVAPTETRYGLLGRADKPETIARLYAIKGRPASLPTAIFVPSLEAIAIYGVMTPAATAIARRFLPGPLTLVLRAVKDMGVPLVVDGHIGIRYSSAPFIVALLKQLDFPITATSANLSGAKDCSTVNEIARAFGGKVDLYVDSGVLDNPVSTVVDVSGDSPVVLRPGAITENAIEGVLKHQVI